MRKFLISCLFSLVCLSGFSQTNLSVNGTANCYMVSKPAHSYSFDASVKGNGIAPYGEDPVISPKTVKGVKVLWQDESVIDPESVVFKNGKVVFKTGRKAKNGNAVIGIFPDKACSEGRCLWSWHIWFTDAVDSGMAGVVFLDRNLGADGVGLLESGLNGLFYQWGRKDPFPQTGCVEAAVYAEKRSVAFSVANPCTFISRDGRWTDDNKSLWRMPSGSPKTMYDPCPPGYRVPGYDAILRIRESGEHSFVKAGARWYDLIPATPDKVGELGYYWTDSLEPGSSSRSRDFYIWNVGTGIGLGSHYYNSSAFCVRPMKM